MQLASPRQAALLAALVGLTTLALMPSPAALIRNPAYTTLGIPLDPSLRVSLPSLFLALPSRPLRIGSQLDGVGFEASAYRSQVATRSDLRERLSRIRGLPLVSLQGREGGERWVVSVPLRAVHYLGALSAQWTLLLAAAFHILVGLLMLAGRRHPVSSPLAVVALLLGFGLLSTLDQLLPGCDGALCRLEPRARIGLLAWSLLPFSVLHLAMRYPVVVRGFRSKGIVLATYALGLCLAVPAQLRFHDAASLDAIEKLCFALALLSALVLISVSLFRRSEFSPIESARARALAAGVVVGWSGPLIVLLSGTSPRPWMSEALSLATLALPLALAWSVLRYQLIDPSSWTVRSLHAVGVFLSGFLLACGALWAIHVIVSPGHVNPPAEVFASALFAILLYQAARRLSQAIIDRAIPVPADPQAVAADAISRLAGARSGSQVFAELEELIRRFLGSAAVEIGALSPAAHAAGTSPLWRRAAEASARVDWLRGRRVRRLDRDADPSPEEPEILLRIQPVVGPPRLLVASARSDGLPYAESEIDAFERLGELVELIVPAALRTTSLESLVYERTRCLERNLQKQADVLRVAEQLLESNTRDDVRRSVTVFAGRFGVDLVWQRTGEFDTSAGTGPARDAEVFELDRLSTVLVPAESAGALAELRTEFATVTAFARLVLPRIVAVSDLRQEVREKSDEIARMMATTYQSDFVRHLAHELRKPVEEAQSLATLLEGSEAEEARARATRIRGICVELQRRLDTLLSHSGIRLDPQRIDLARVVRGAVARARAIERQRDYVIENELDPLPLIADPTRLLAVVENLIDNAIRATEEAGRIRVRSGIDYGEEMSMDVPCVFIEVQDEGCGIGAGTEGSIFEPGFSTFPGGFGLGLSLCRATARAHGGSIRALPSKVGARLRLTLPQHPSEGACPRHAKQPAEDGVSSERAMSEGGD